MTYLEKLVAWYPCYKSIIEAVFNGSLRYRLKMEKTKHTDLHIIANGPSALDTVKSLSFTDRAVDSMMLNDAYKTELFVKIKPTYYCFADPIDLRPWKEATDYINAVLKHNPGVITIVPAGAKTDIGYWKRIVLKKIFISGVPLNNKLYDIRLLKDNLMSPPMWNVSIFALYAGIQLGYKNIYLHGYDMTLYDNVKVTSENKVVLLNNHYYDENSNYTYLNRTMEYLYDAISNNYTSFNILAKYAESLSVKITNMSPISKLDMFDRYSKKDNESL